MNDQLSRLFSYHRVFVVYLLSLSWLAAGSLLFALENKRGMENFVLILGIVAGVAVIYGVLWGCVRKALPSFAIDRHFEASRHLNVTRRRLLLAIVILYGLVVVAHFSVLGYIPFIEALRGESDIGISLIRQKGYFDLPIILRYASDYSVKAFGPTLLVIAYYFRSRMFWSVLVIGVFYSLALLARVLPVILLAPLVIYMLSQRRWLHTLLAIFLLGVMLNTVTSIASIEIREATIKPEITAADVAIAKDYDLSAVQKSTGDWRRTSTAYALYERALILPGRVIDQWFYFYDSSNVREKGCGYRLLASLLKCNYVPIPSKLYAAFYEENVKQGMRGSLNAASFMTDYANFGLAGFLLSCLSGAGLFTIIMVIYQDHPLALSLNVPLIVVAMETSLLTAINSGAGWLLTTAMFVLFFRLRNR